MVLHRQPINLSSFKYCAKAEVNQGPIPSFESSIVSDQFSVQYEAKLFNETLTLDKVGNDL